MLVPFAKRMLYLVRRSAVRFECLILTISLAIEPTLLRAQSEILVQKVVELDASMISGAPLWVSRDKKGLFYVIDTPDRRPKVFSPDGKFVRWLGGAGAGPGEFRMARVVLVGAKDSLFVLDPANGRVSIFNPLGKYVSQFPLRVASLTDAILLPSGNIVLNGTFTAAGTIGFTLQEIDRSGARRAAFSEMKRVISLDDAWRLMRRLAVDPARGLWSFGAFSQLGELYSFGHVLTETVSPPSWFLQLGEHETPLQGGIGGKEPAMEVRAVWLDEAKRVWVATQVPKPDWRRWSDEKKPQANSSMWYETIVSVYDGASRAWIGQRRLPGLRITRALGEDLVAIVSYSNDGEITTLSIHRVSLMSAKARR